MDKLVILPESESALRLSRFCEVMRREQVDAAIVSDNATKYYLTGRVFSGWLLVGSDMSLRAFVKRPVDLEGDNVVYVRKPEEIVVGDTVVTVGLEYATLTVSEYNRIVKVMGARRIADISPLIREVRAVKTPMEIDLIKRSGELQTAVYRGVPSLFVPGMTDTELQIEIERSLRLAGCLGQFRISGSDMELFMGNILVGDNADNPSPYDFAMGGAGVDPSLPVGADNREIREGDAVMVDANGNFTGYMTDMTRTFRLGEISPLALRAHQCSIDICRRLASMGRPGVKASVLFETAATMAAEEGLADYFMGHRQKAGFVGHGIGIEINEAPVIAPRSRDILAAGNVVALEPKFVIPGTGAVGIENSYLVTDDCMVCLTHAPEEILPLDKNNKQPYNPSEE